MMVRYRVFSFSPCGSSEAVAYFSSINQYVAAFRPSRLLPYQGSYISDAHLFRIDFEMLLYERTSTYFEGEMEQNPKTQRWLQPLGIRPRRRATSR
jgi:hypothetical protein